MWKRREDAEMFSCELKSAQIECAKACVAGKRTAYDAIAVRIEVEAP